MGNILVIEDDQDTRYVLKVVLENKKHAVEGAASGNEAVSVLENHVFDAVLLDRVLGDMDGLSLLEKIKQEDPGLPVIMLTGHADVQSAVKAMKLGALDYLVKPFSNEELCLIIERAVKERKFLREFEAMRRHIMNSNSRDFVFGESPAIKAVINQIEQVADTDLTVILTGASGSGKEVWARQLHKLSSRNKNPFVPLDCGALPENLVESELFGYEKGAFTGAEKQRAGLLETAFGGTLFLDEISNLNLSTQAKLLRVLQERKIRHLGGKKDMPVDVRIIVASNKNLDERIREGNFREDLFHRLNQFSIKLPSLKNRKEDIPALCVFFLKEANKTLKKNVSSISDEAIKILKEYDWPGNIRELKNTITRAALMSDKTIMPVHLGLGGFSADQTDIQKVIASHPANMNKLQGQTNSFNAQAEKENLNIKETVKPLISEVEKKLILKALSKANGNKVLASKLLGIDRKALYTKIKEHEIK